MGIRNRLSIVVALLLLAIAALVGLFSGPLGASIQRPIEMLSILPGATRLIPCLFFVILGISYLIDRENDPDTLTASGSAVPEQPQRAPELVGDAFETTVEEAVTDIRLERTVDIDTEPYQQLRTAAQRALQFRAGYDPEEATNALESGTWTTDPVARAFFSPTVEYPIAYRLLRWMQPERAYRRSLERTSTVVYRLVSTGEATPVANETSGSWARRLLSQIQFEGTAQSVSEETAEDEAIDKDKTEMNTAQSDAPTESESVSQPETVSR